jgi:hypothetical protein
MKKIDKCLLKGQARRRREASQERIMISEWRAILRQDVYRREKNALGKTKIKNHV